MLSFTNFTNFFELDKLWSDLNILSLDLSLATTISYWNALTLEAEHVSTFLKNTSSLSFNNLFIFNLIFNITFIFSTTICLIIFLCNQGLRPIAYNLSNSDNYSVVFSYMTEINEELGSFDDVIIFILIFAIIILWFFFFVIFSSYIIKSLSWIIMLLNFVVLAAVISPVFVLKSFGLSFVSYIRGAGKTTSFIAEIFFDFIAVAVLISRFFIQNIRFLVLFGAFFEISEFIYDNCSIVGTTYVDNILSYSTAWTNKNLYWYDILTDFLIQQMLYGYYFCHLLISFFAQMSNYFLLTFFLFFFLYTSFTLESCEKYFLYKRL